MGREVTARLAKEPELDLAGGVDPLAKEEYLDLPAGGGLIPIGRDLEAIIQRVRPRVMVDFTHPDAAMGNVRVALKNKVSPVVGTSGIKPADLDEVRALAEEAGVAAGVGPNIAVRADPMLPFAPLPAQFFSPPRDIQLAHH